MDFAELTVRCMEGNFPPRKPLISRETGKESRSALVSVTADRECRRTAPPPFQRRAIEQRGIAGGRVVGQPRRRRARAGRGVRSDQPHRLREALQERHATMADEDHRDSSRPKNSSQRIWASNPIAQRPTGRYTSTHRRESRKARFQPSGDRPNQAGHSREQDSCNRNVTRLSEMEAPPGMASRIESSGDNDVQP